MATGTSAFAIRELEDLFVPVLRNCVNMIGLKKIHAHILKLSLSQSNFLVTKMVDFCDNSGDMEYASLLFKQVVEPNGFLYNAMIRAYTHNNRYTIAITQYKQMLTNPQAENPILPDKFTFPFVIKSCAGLSCHFLGQQVHAQVWYARIGCYADALDAFRRMQEVGIEPDDISIVSVLPACAQLGALEVGKWIHMYADKKGFSRDDSKSFSKDIFWILELLALHHDSTDDMIEDAHEDIS
ncbi:pentatricopeptide repeat-containing protein At2g20540-like [Fagus crenata]